ncbi:homocysteine biosynthesis protein [Dolichospermum sp. ST_con]|nr:homocysteine biosynthesis protein [Dolichospermum sp. ST_con]MDD1419993.1 homocysteine biosynthesis protein [Dolichospermum sp. ST_sed1]MDD1423133.1 homocysteine biosynthesis protein [Dolichospermum sp. ST_sed9]MDD1429563.1 homocysteine biosynthesis protein [Dolichospermum sp. ST_sed6]MDD1435048.1 homocysteine biosynthesis protein [Dolichospermum sp. ST_sed10]MDD1438867.1 homocysteine biosynthesis protein [Dolichospermum sp. ST_sed3]MDD1445009.1 homocysteine biosynthesis protein [Dolichosp
MRTITEINEKISQKRAVVWTAEELKARVAEIGVNKAAKEVDVITTGTFEPMESSGAIINLGHTDPPIKIRRCWLDGVPAYAGFGAVDLYLGASCPVDSVDGEDVRERGGGHVIEDLIAGKSIQVRAVGQVTDCYPRATFETTVTRDTINQFYLFNPRNLYQNFIVGVNGGDRPLHTYLGPLQPRLGNAVYSNPGSLSPLLNDPDLQLVGIGTKIFLAGGIGYVAWEGTQHFPLQKRLENRTPIGPSATLALIGDAKQMDARWIRGCYFKSYGPSLMMGVGVPLPVLNAGVVERCAVQDKDLVAPIVDFSIPRRVRPTFGLVSYAQLKSGRITIEGRTVRVASLASLFLSRKVAQELKQWITEGIFTLTEPVAPIPMERSFLPQDRWTEF